MARPKNEGPPEGTVTLNIEDFQRTRDSVIVALATLQSSVQDLSRAYINHANTVLGGPTNNSLLSLNLAGTLLDTGLVGQQPARTTSPPRSEAGDAKKKRKRAPHDPNAPKRALTPYFLYMHSARSQIANELGAHAKPKEVAEEGTRRWAVMADEDKSVWNSLYQRNLGVYRVKMKAYKAGQPIPDDEEAAKLVDAGVVPIAPVAEPEPEVEEEDEDEESSPEPVKAPSPPKGKRRKTAEKPATPAKETPAVAAPAKKSPEKKKAEKKTPVAAAPAKVAAPAAESGKKKKPGKK